MLDRIPSLPTDAEKRAFVRRTGACLGGAALLGVIVQILFACFVSRAEVVGWMKSLPLPVVQLAVFVGAAWLARWWSDSGVSRRRQLAALGLHACVQSITLAPVTVLVVGSGSMAAWGASLLLLCLIGLCVLAELGHALDFYRADCCEATALALSASVAEPFWYGGKLIRCAIRVRD